MDVFIRAFRSFCCRSLKFARKQKENKKDPDRRHIPTVRILLDRCVFCLLNVRSPLPFSLFSRIKLFCIFVYAIPVCCFCFFYTVSLFRNYRYHFLIFFYFFLFFSDPVRRMGDFSVSLIFIFQYSVISSSQKFIQGDSIKIRQYNKPAEIWLTFSYFIASVCGTIHLKQRSYFPLGKAFAFSQKL